MKNIQFHQWRQGISFETEILPAAYLSVILQGSFQIWAQTALMGVSFRRRWYDILIFPC